MVRESGEGGWRRAAGGGRYGRVEYHPHARLRMRQRRVSERQVERAIESPTRRQPSTNPPGRIVAERDTAVGNTLRIVYVEREGGATAFVLTVYRIGGTSQ